MFVATDPPNHKGKSDVWLTPLDLIKRIGDFDLDPCPFPGHMTAKYLEPADGLKSDWFGKVWLNPPYSEAERWVKKLAAHGNGCALLFVRTGSRWMQDALEDCDSILFIKGRIKFMRPDKSVGSNAGCDSMLLCYGMIPKDPSLGVLIENN